MFLTITKGRNFMNFIFPKNYDFKTKLLGIIDYSTVFINILWYVFVFFIINILFKSINIKIFFFILLCFPLLIFSLSGFNGENILYVLKYIIKFILKQKIILYSKK